MAETIKFGSQQEEQPKEVVQFGEPAAEAAPQTPDYVSWVWNNMAAPFRATYRGMMSYAANTNSFLDEAAGLISDGVNKAMNEQGEAIAELTGEKFEPRQYLGHTDVFYQGAVRNALESIPTPEEMSYDTLVTKFARMTGAMVPEIVEIATWRKFATENAVKLIQQLPKGAKVAESALVNRALPVGSMYAYGQFRSGFMGGMDLVAMDMLNSITMGMSMPGRIAVQAAYGWAISRRHGATDEEAYQNALFSGIYGAVGPKTATTYEKQLLLLGAQNIRNWTQSKPANRNSPSYEIDPAITDMVNQDVNAVLSEFHPDIHRAVRLSETGKLPVAGGRPIQMMIDNIVARVGDVGGISTRGWDRGTLRNGITAYLRDVDVNKELNPKQLALYADAMTEALFKSEEVHFAGRMGAGGGEIKTEFGLFKPPTLTERPVPGVPLGTDVIQFGSAKEPVQIPGKMPGEVLVTTREAAGSTNVVELPSGTKISVPVKRAAMQQAFTDDMRASEARKEKLLKSFGFNLSDALDPQNVKLSAQEKLFDRYARLLDALPRTKEGRAFELMLGAYRNSSNAIRFQTDAMQRDIYGGLSKQDVSDINSIVYANNAREIGARRSEYKFPVEGMTSDDFHDYTMSALQSLTPERRTKIVGAIQKRYAAHQAITEELVQEGVFAREDGNKLAALPFSPIKFMSELEATLGESEGLKSPLSVASSPARKLAAGGEDLAIYDDKDLFAGYFMYAKSVIWKNRLLKQLARLGQKELGQEPTQLGDPLVFKGDVEGGLVKVPELNEKGEPIVPDGYSLLHYMDEGQKKPLVMETQYKNVLDADPGPGAEMGVLAATLLGGNIVKGLATVSNPEWAIGVIQRDMEAYWLTDHNPAGYSNVLPLAMMQGAFDVMKVLPDAIKKTGRAADYINEAGGFTFSGAMAERLTKVARQKILLGQDPGALRKGASATIHALGAIGDRTELTLRLAYRERLIANGVEPATASQEALDVLNFARRGAFADRVESFYPYFSVTMQSMERIARSAKADPAAFQQKVAQLLAVEMLLYASNMQQNPDGMRDVSAREKLNSHIIMLPPMYDWIDSNGNKRHRYVAFRKESHPYFSAFQAGTFMALEASYFGDTSPSEYMKEVAKGASPLRVLEDGSVELLPPLPAAVTNYFRNRDPSTGAAVYRGPPVEAWAEYKAGQTPEFWQAAGQFGASPMRLQNAAERFAPSNPITGMASLWLSPLPKPQQDETWMAIVRDMPVFRRFVRSTHPASKELEDMDMVYRRLNTQEKVKLTDPVDLVLKDIGENKINEDQAYSRIEQLGVSGLEQVSGFNSVRAFARSHELWKVYRKQFPALDEQLGVSPFWFSRLANMDGKTRANMYYPKWKELEGKQRGILEQMFAEAGLSRSAEFNQEFESLVSQFGSDYRMEK